MNRVERYLNPYTDFGFKRLFGEEVNKDLLISFLNALLAGEQVITNISYSNSEHLGVTEEDRKAVFDVYCENDRGEKFIVEMQKAGQKYFKDRSVFYSTFPIREQAPQGRWDFELKAVYTIGILNFVFDEDKEDPEYFHHEVKLMDTRKKEVFYDKLTFIYLEMPKFNKTEDQLETLFDKWLYVLKNLPDLLDRPAALQERVFERVFRLAEISRFNRSEMANYEESLKVFRDLHNVLDYAEEKALERGFAKGMAQGMAQGMARGMEQGLEQGLAEGLEQGRAEGEKRKQLEIARNMKQAGMDVEQIVLFTGLSLEEVKTL